MQATPEDLQGALKKIQDFEEWYPMRTWPGGWTAEMVGINPAYLLELEEAGVIKPVRDENGRMERVAGDLATGYCRTPLGFNYHFPSNGSGVAANSGPAATLLPVELPEDLFDSIVGYDDVKELLLAALLSPRPVHVLLVGPPALAKSLFLWEIERAYSDRSLWLLGSATSQPAMWDMVAEQQPEVLLFDEFEKMKAVDQSALLSLMEGGRLVRAKVGRYLNANLECRVFAAANTVNRLTPEILSRFARRTLRPYQSQEFRQVVASVLSQREGVGEEVAQEIGELLVGHTQDVRDAIRAARLSHQVGSRRAVELLGLLDTN